MRSSATSDPFEGPLVLQAVNPCRGRQRYTLLRPLTFQRGLLWPTITVPAGFCTDFASIPSLLQLYLDDDDPVILRPSVLHDWLYSCKGQAAGWRMTRADTDALLIEAMGRLGARRDQQLAVWMAVRLFGRSHWGRQNP